MDRRDDDAEDVDAVEIARHRLLQEHSSALTTGITPYTTWTACYSRCLAPGTSSNTFSASTRQRPHNFFVSSFSLEPGLPQMIGQKPSYHARLGEHTCALQEALTRSNSGLVQRSNDFLPCHQLFIGSAASWAKQCSITFAIWGFLCSDTRSVCILIRKSSFFPICEKQVGNIEFTYRDAITYLLHYLRLSSRSSRAPHPPFS